ncbi:carbohydrate ABC transporter membrane protein 1 (CUT1 family) [Bacillus oleivorans]|uniref:Carbohydrate ABC transporter membrane protein 1 (CUT1 family) n=1 Tax=Bacillus oleivorans TaxID=1448271 RepID=A0A285CHS3_9BACI|nr:sugar ABC transporter permease [Bacillus oleivorans]SNX66885.1 carbohydrate ABC transporter membrane protein 1 (CUT1 family) [Bacillus oleivorans]
MRKLGFKEFLFLLPAFLLIGVFSLWPVVQSLTYTFFDYQLNDQQKAGLYTNERFNVDLFQTSQFYIGRFLEQDQENITNPEDWKKVEGVLERLRSTGAEFEGSSGVIELSGSVGDQVLNLYEDTNQLVTELNQTYTLTNAENLQLQVEELKNSIVSSNFIGLDGYKQALQDERVGIALKNTFLFTVVSVFFEFIFGLILALILNKAIKGRGLIRTSSLIPWAIPTAVAALMWSYLYDGGSGIVAHIFAALHLIESPRDLLLTGTGAMISTIVADVWKTTPYMALLLLAGLQTIPHSLYEAASIDGAGKIQTFFRITLPLLKPAILVALLFRTLDAFRVFDLIYVLTGGGPGGSTETLSIYGYKLMFSQTNFGYGSVIIMLMFVCVAILAIIFVRFLGTNLMEKQ